jgi:hypothetical protein
MRRYFILSTLLLSINASAWDSGWLDPQTQAEQSDNIISFTIPQSVLAQSGKAIEEIVIIGQRKEDKKIQPLKDFSYEWVSDFEGDNYGLKIKFTQEQKLPIRLYFAPDLAKP